MVLGRFAKKEAKSFKAFTHGDMQIVVSTIGGEQHTVDVKRSDSINNVKFKLQHKSGIHRADQQLIFGVEQLEDWRSLSSYNIQKGSTLHVVIMVIRIFVRISTEQTIALDVRPSDTIENVKAKVQENVCLRDGFKIYYPAQDRVVLGETLSLYYCGVVDGDTLHTTLIDY
jgi:ubiquitin C